MWLVCSLPLGAIWLLAHVASGALVSEAAGPCQHTASSDPWVLANALIETTHLQVLDARYAGVAGQSALFDCTSAVFDDMGTGVIMTTGAATDFFDRPDRTPSRELRTPGSSLAATLVSGATVDCAVLSVVVQSLTPSVRGVAFTSLFSSTECDVVSGCAIFPDPYAVFVDGQACATRMLNGVPYPLVSDGYFDADTATMGEDAFPNQRRTYKRDFSCSWDQAAETHSINIVVCDFNDGSFDSAALLQDMRGCGPNDDCGFGCTVPEVPTITCPADFTVEATLTAGGPCGMVLANWTTPTADECGETVTAEGLPTDGFYPVGDTNVTFTSALPNGATATCSVVVTVLDSSPPVFVYCPSDITVSASSAGINAGMAVTYNTPTATDNLETECGVTVRPVYQRHASGNIFPVGVTRVIWFAEDAFGNRADDCTFLVTVRMTAPLVYSFTLVETNVTAFGQRDVRELQDGDEVAYRSLVTIRANVVLPSADTTVGRVELQLDGAPVVTELFAPYFLAGDTDGTAKPLAAGLLLPGPHVIKATAYTAASGGQASQTRSVSFTVVSRTCETTPQPDLTAHMDNCQQTYPVCINGEYLYEDVPERVGTPCDPASVFPGATSTLLGRCQSRRGCVPILTAGTYVSKLELYDATTSELVTVLDPAADNVVALSPNRFYSVKASLNQPYAPNYPPFKPPAVAWSVDTNAPFSFDQSNGITDFFFFDSGNTLLSGTSARTTSRWRPQPGRTLLRAEIVGENGKGWHSASLAVALVVVDAEPLMHVVSMTLVSPAANANPFPDTPLQDGAVITFPNINIRADVDGTQGQISAVKFVTNGPTGREVQVEKIAPYSAKGDTDGAYWNWFPAHGRWCVSAFVELVGGARTGVVTRCFLVTNERVTGTDGQVSLPGGATGDQASAKDTPLVVGVFVAGLAVVCLTVASAYYALRGRAASSAEGITVASRAAYALPSARAPSLPTLCEEVTTQPSQQEARTPRAPLTATLALTDIHQAYNELPTLDTELVPAAGSAAYMDTDHVI